MKARIIRFSHQATVKLKRGELRLEIEFMEMVEDPKRSCSLGGSDCGGVPGGAKELDEGLLRGLAATIVDSS